MSSSSTGLTFEEWLKTLPDDDSCEASYLILHGKDGQQEIARFVFEKLNEKQENANG